MIKKIAVSIFCMLVITAGFSLSVLSEQNKEYTMTELKVSCSERMLYGNNLDDNTPTLSYVLDTLDQQQTFDSGVSYTISENGYYAQSFIPTLEQLTRLELKLFKKGGPNGLNISVRSSLTGVALTSKYLPGTSISTNATWHEFNFPDIIVTPGNTYYIVWDPIGVPDFDNNFYWSIGTGNPYVNGLAWKFLGSIWEIHNPTTYPNPDFCFKTYGISGGGNNPPNKPTTPSGPTTGSVGENHHYESYISDPDGDGMEVYFDWGDGTHTGWVGILANGTVGNYKTWSSAATYQVRVKTRDTPHLAESPWSNSLSVTINDTGNFAPNKPSTPLGPTSGSMGVSYTYSSTTTDPESDQISYWFDWDDGTNSGWIGPYNSGDICPESHVWSIKGSYAVKVKAKDINDAESVWSDPLPISMPRTMDITTSFFIKILQNHPFFCPLLRQLLIDQQEI